MYARVAVGACVCACSVYEVQRACVIVWCVYTCMCMCALSTVCVCMGAGACVCVAGCVCAFCTGMRSLTGVCAFVCVQSTKCIDCGTAATANIHKIVIIISWRLRGGRRAAVVTASGEGPACQMKAIFWKKIILIPPSFAFGRRVGRYRVERSTPPPAAVVNECMMCSFSKYLPIETHWY